jgi:hypothetical protein
MATDINITENLGSATEIVFSFDTTGSMNPCIANVRRHIEKTCEELYQNIPNLKVGFIAHGDYCDGNRCHQTLSLTDNKADVFNFIRNAPATGGGDAPECYELVLNLTKTLGWSDAKGGKVLVMIGDDEPHPTDYPENKDHLDWRKEAKELKEMGINAYPLQCLYSPHRTGPNKFWSELAEIMGTPLLKLQDFDEATEAVKAFAFASGGSKAYGEHKARRLKAGGAKLSPAMEALDTALEAEAVKYDTMEEVKDKDEDK